MIAEQRVVLCMRELRRPCDCHDELRCPPHTTFHDMEEAVKALNEGVWVDPIPDEKAAPIQPKTFDRLYVAFWATYVLAYVGVLGWVVYGVISRAHG